MKAISRMSRPVTLLVLVVWCITCQLVAAPTKDKGGVEGAVSWIFFIGLWVGIVAFVVVLLDLVIRHRRTAQ